MKPIILTFKETPNSGFIDSEFLVLDSYLVDFLLDNVEKFSNEHDLKYNKLVLKDYDELNKNNMFRILTHEFIKIKELVEKHNLDLEFNNKFNKILND